MSRFFNDANSQYLQYAGAIVAGVPLTMACFFRTDDTSVIQALMDISDNNTQFDCYALRLAGTGGALQATHVQGGSGAVAATTINPIANRWYHGAAVFAGASDRRVFLDGRHKGSETSNRTNPAVNTTTIGGHQTNSGRVRYMSGLIDLPAIWNAALADSEILRLAMGAHPTEVRPDALMEWWEFRHNGNPATGGRNRFTLTSATYPNPSLTESWQPTRVPRFGLRRGLYVSTGGAAWTKSLTDSISLTDSRLLLVSKAVSQAFGLSDSRSLLVTKAISNLLLLTDARLLQASKRLTDAFAISDARSTSTTKVLADALSLLDSRSVAILKRLGESFGITDLNTAGIVGLAVLIQTIVTASGDGATFSGRSDDSLFGGGVG